MHWLKDIESLEGKRVFLRLDLNVPLKGKSIVDETRIMAALPTIEYLLDKKARLVIASHLGRPKFEDSELPDEQREKYSLEPVATRLAEILDREVILIDDPASDTPKALLMESKFEKVILLENLRFDAGEKKNSGVLAQHWSKYVDIYINDAFGSCHRAHCSVEALPQIMDNKAAGFLIEKELHALSKIQEQTQVPFVVALGGSKVSDKIKVIERFMESTDTMIIGGAMAYTFLKAQGHGVGQSLVEPDCVSLARDVIRWFEARDKSLLLPVDHLVAPSLDRASEWRKTDTAVIDDGWMGLDIGPKTIELYSEVIRQSGTVFWNGPMGVYEQPPFHQGSQALAKAMSECEGYTVIGGGDSAAATKEAGFSDSVSHISTGGGASLELLEGKVLPGIAALGI